MPRAPGSWQPSGSRSWRPRGKRLDRPPRQPKFLAAGCLFFLFAVPSFLWLRLNRAAPNWDDAWYLSNSLTLYDAWSAGGLAGLARHFLASLGFKAPLITALPLPFFWIFGRRWHAAFLVNAAAMMVLFVAVWRIARRLRGDRAGLIAVYIAGTLPLLYGLSRWYLVEYPLAAAVAVTFWLMLVTAESLSLVPMAALGLACGFGLLLKADFPLFVFPGLIYVALRRRIGLREVLAFALPCAAVAAPWYAFHWRATLANALAAGFGKSATVQGTGPVFSSGAIVAYLRMVVNRGVSAYYTVLGGVALIAVVLQRRVVVFRQTAVFGLWLAPFLVFLFGGNKDVRYIAPILPAFALALACILDAATENRKWLAAAVLVFPFVSALAVSFGWPYQSPGLSYAIRYDRNSWGQDEILSAIAGAGDYRYGERKTILVATDRAHFNADNFSLAAVQRQLPFEVDTTAYSTGADEVVRQAERAAYVVYKQGGEPESQFFNTHSMELLERLKESPDWEEMPFSHRTPDGGTAHIIRHLITN
jgi:Dolichyl-phosphate-mannose-protein mannosyltransferase